MLNIGPARCYRQLQNVPIDDLWSQLCLVAKDPIEESCYGEQVIHYCAEFGKFSDLNNLSFFQEWSSSQADPLTVFQAHPTLMQTFLLYGAIDIGLVPNTTYMATSTSCSEGKSKTSGNSHTIDISHTM